MNYIYHEKQEGSLCAQHCLNNLLQGQYFSAVDLSEIARQMDQEERRRMAELGTNTDDFRKFIEQPSSNMDDSGMFSVQVLSSALKIWDLALIPFGSSNTLAKAARENSVMQRAYICNFREHWLTVRRLGQQWFNLNSLLTFPELISDTYLSLFLTQLQHEGYSIFIVDGSLPSSEADEALNLCPIVQTVKPELLSEKSKPSTSRTEHEELKAVLTASLAKAGYTTTSSDQSTSVSSVVRDDSTDDLNKALQMSMEDTTASTSSQNHSTEEEDIQKAISLSLEQMEGTSSTSKSSIDSPVNKSHQVMTKSVSSSSSSSSHRVIEDESSSSDLEKALQMSLDSALCDTNSPKGPLEHEIEIIRQKRLKKLNNK